MINFNWKHKTKALLLKSGLSAILQRRCLNNVYTILAYHSIQQVNDVVRISIGAGITIEPDVFEQQIKYISTNCSPVSMDDIADFLDSGKKLPSRAVAITFDDGFRDNIDIAAPILKKFNVKATVYLTAGYIEAGRSPCFVRLRYAFLSTSVKKWKDPVSGLYWNLENKKEAYEAFLTTSRYTATWSLQKKEEYTCLVEEALNVSYDIIFGSCLMSWGQVEEFRDHGHTIGAHTISHPNLIRIPLSLAEEEVHKSKQLIAENTGIVPIHFAYPNPILNPNWNDSIALLLKENGFRTSVTSDAGGVTRKSDPYALKRMSTPVDRIDFQWKLDLAQYDPFKI